MGRVLAGLWLSLAKENSTDEEDERGQFRSSMCKSSDKIKSRMNLIAVQLYLEGRASVRDW